VYVAEMNLIIDVDITIDVPKVRILAFSGVKKERDNMTNNAKISSGVIIISIAGLPSYALWTKKKYIAERTNQIVTNTTTDDMALKRISGISIVADICSISLTSAKMSGVTAFEKINTNAASATASSMRICLRILGINV